MCPEEFYCDNRYAPVVLYQNSTCPPGHYCPNGTKHAYEFPCPVGTFSGASGLSRVSECSPCPGGYYCDELGQTTYTKQCDQGQEMIMTNFNYHTIFLVSVVIECAIIIVIICRVFLPKWCDCGNTRIQCNRVI